MSKSKSFSEELLKHFEKGKKLVLMQIAISEIMSVQQELFKEGNVEKSERLATVASLLAEYYDELLQTAIHESNSN